MLNAQCSMLNAQCSMLNAEVLQLLSVFRIESFEREGGNGCSDELRDEVDPDLRKAHELHYARAYRHGGVERATRDAAHGESAHHHGHADGQPVERIVRRALGRSNIEHNKSE